MYNRWVGFNSSPWGILWLWGWGGGIIGLPILQRFSQRKRQGITVRGEVLFEKPSVLVHYSFTSPLFVYNYFIAYNYIYYCIRLYWWSVIMWLLRQCWTNFKTQIKTLITRQTETLDTVDSLCNHMQCLYYYYKSRLPIVSLCNTVHSLLYIKNGLVFLRWALFKCSTSFRNTYLENIFRLAFISTVVRFYLSCRASNSR